MNPTNATGPASGGGTERSSAFDTAVTLRRLVLEAPYGPAVVKTEPDRANSRVTYKISADSFGVIVTVEPEYGGGHVAIPRGVDLHIACNGIRDTVTIPYIGDRGDRADIPTGLLPGCGTDPHLLAAVLRAVIRDWANRPDLHRLRRRAAAPTAAEHLPAARRLIEERQANLGCVLTELDDLHHVVGELRGLAAEHRNKPRPYDADSGVGPLPDSPVQRAGRAARAVAVHARYTDSRITTDDLNIPAIAGCAVTNLFIDLLYLLHMVGIDPGEVMAAASEVYDTEQAEHSDT